MLRVHQHLPMAIACVALLAIYPSASKAADTANVEKVGTELPNTKKYDLKYKLKPNQQWIYDVSYEGILETFVGAETNSIINSSKSQRRFIVTAVDATSHHAEVEVRTNWAQTATSFRGAATMDKGNLASTDVASEEQMNELDALSTTGRSKTIVCLTPTGTLTNTRNAIVTFLPWADNSFRPAVVSTADSSSESFIRLPMTPIAIGETWKHREELVLLDNDLQPTKVLIQRRYTLLEVQGMLATIESRTALLTPVKDARITTRVFDCGRSETIVFDLARGMMISRASRMSQTALNPVGHNDSVRAEYRRVETLVGPEN